MHIHVPVQEERDPGPGVERCCFCRHKTKWWTALPDRKPGEQVACCVDCSSRALPEDVPAKSVWIRRERIASPPPIGSVY